MLQKLDSFGQNLQLHFRGTNLFKSKLGGLISLIIQILVLGYGLTKIQKLVNKADPTIISIDKVVDLSKTKYLNLTENGFDLAISIYDTDYS